jgi:hypothetical protein
MSIKSLGRARLPTCETRIRSALRFMTMVLASNGWNNGMMES